MTAATLTPPAGVAAASVPFVPPPVAEAFYGLAGDIVRAIEPHSEADPLAILAQLLVMFGNVIGRGPYFQVEADRHHTNLYIVLVGDTAKARKGVSFNQALRPFRAFESAWATERVQSGLSSGEGLIYAVTEPDTATQDLRLAMHSKRLLVYEPEFALVLQV